MKPVKLIALCLFMIAAAISEAQDLMYLRGQKQPLKVKVTELGLDEIKYRYWPVDNNTPVQVIAKDNVSKVVLEKGDTYSFAEGGMNAAANYDNQRKHAIKVAFLSPLFGHLGLSYEKSIKPGRSYELGVGLIGAGAQYGEKKSTGVFLRAGYKFLSSPDFYLRGMRYAHVLKGFYAKPELVLGYYNMSYSSYYYSGGFNVPVTFGGALMNIGKQWVFDDAFLLDMYFGLGYGFSVYSIDGNITEARNEVYHYAFLGGHNNFPIAVSAGLKIGFLTGKKGGGAKPAVSEK